MSNFPPPPDETGSSNDGGFPDWAEQPPPQSPTPPPPPGQVPPPPPGQVPPPPPGQAPPPPAWGYQAPVQPVPPAYAQAAFPAGQSAFGARYGEFFPRFAGLMIDGIAIMIIPAIVGIMTIVLAPTESGLCTDFNGFTYECTNPDPAFVLIGMAMAILLALVIAFLIVIKPMGENGQSLGMKTMGLRCVDANTGKPIGVGRSFGRYLFASFVSGNFCYLGYLWLFFDDKKQTWHDKVVNSIVISDNG